MHVMILGSGVIGTTTAYYLARAGHQVTVVDRQPGPALETSYANAGEVSPGYSAPWAGPGILIKAIKWLLMHHSPLVIWPMLDAAMWRWGADVAQLHGRAATASTRRAWCAWRSTAATAWSSCAETRIAYDERTGHAAALSHAEAASTAWADIEILQQVRRRHEVLDRARFRAPSSRRSPRSSTVRRTLRLPGDETGDCFKFTNNLAAMAASRARRVPPGHRDGSIVAGEGSIAGGVRTRVRHARRPTPTSPPGQHAAHGRNPLGLRLPVYPVKGYSITVPIADAGAPESTIMDETHKGRGDAPGGIRVGGTAELAGFSRRLRDGGGARR